jgi:tRNA-specific 2-thiouridylase
MFNWSADEAGRCQAAADFDDATAICENLDIPLHRADFSREYKARVFRYFLHSYAAGRTPNPDVLCNREIKFDAFLRYAERLGADYIATGHYARLTRKEGGVRLLRGADLNKDQSYFLAAVAPAALKRTLFPLGGAQKADVRAQAKAAGLAVHAKPDSTGICFIGERDFAGFLHTYLSGRAGPVRVAGGALDGRTIAEHAGLIYYTIGQRRWLGLGGVAGAAPRPWYVVAKDSASATLWVSQDRQHVALRATCLSAETPHWLVEPPVLPLTCAAQIRYRQRAIDCRVSAAPQGGVTVEFARAPRAIAPGQYVVFYDGDQCLGSAEIRAAGVPDSP